MSETQSQHGTSVVDRFDADNDLRIAVREHLREHKTPCNSWFISRHIADELGANSKAVGLCMMAINQDPQTDLRIAEVRERSTFNRYRVTIQ